MHTVGSHAAPSRRVVLASTAGLLAGWSATGSLGVLADPLRMAVVYLLVTVAVAAVWNRRSLRHGLGWVAIAIWLIPLVLAADPVQTLLLVAATLGILAIELEGADRSALRTVGLVLLLFAGYRWGCESVAGLWWLSDQLGRAIGQLGGWLADRPLRVGASFAGLDYLVVMSALYVLMLWQVRRRAPQAAGAGLAIWVAHGLYLAILAWAWDLARWLPEHPDPIFDHPYTPPPWDWSRTVASWLPWHLPLLGAVLHASLAAVLLRSAPWRKKVSGAFFAKHRRCFAKKAPDTFFADAVGDGAAQSAPTWLQSCCPGSPTSRQVGAICRANDCWPSLKET